MKKLIKDKTDMYNKVKFSAFSIIATAIVLILFVIGTISLRHQTEDLILFCIIADGGTLAGLYYCPRAVEADSMGITLYRLLSKPKYFDYDDIQSVDTCYPSGGSIRLCGSGGFFGFWGYFSDILIGTYFGYYGSRNYCFAVKLKSGRQYVIGCSDPYAFTAYINSQMSKRQGYPSGSVPPAEQY